MTLKAIIWHICIWYIVIKHTIFTRGLLDTYHGIFRCVYTYLLTKLFLLHTVFTICIMSIVFAHSYHVIFTALMRQAYNKRLMCVDVVITAVKQTSFTATVVINIIIINIEITSTTTSTMATTLT